MKHRLLNLLHIFPIIILYLFLH